MAKKNISNKQKIFIENYINNGFNATKAYLDAGYKTTYNGARTEGSKLLAKPNIKKEILNRIDNILEDKADLTRKWIKEVYHIAFSNLTDFVSWKNNIITLKNSDEIDESQSRAIIEISENKDNCLKIKLCSKERALDMIGKYLSLFTENIDFKGTITIKDLDKMFSAWTNKK